jgi:hypothetical protein
MVQPFVLGAGLPPQLQHSTPSLCLEHSGTGCGIDPRPIKKGMTGIRLRIQFLMRLLTRWERSVEAAKAVLLHGSPVLAEAKEGLVLRRKRGGASRGLEWANVSHDNVNESRSFDGFVSRYLRTMPSWLTIIKCGEVVSDNKLWLALCGLRLRLCLAGARFPHVTTLPYQSLHLFLYGSALQLRIHSKVARTLQSVKNPVLKRLTDGVNQSLYQSEQVPASCWMETVASQECLSPCLSERSAG